jgi:hypothetical protein
MSDEMEIGKVEMHDDGEHLIVTIELKNTSATRTLHAYAHPRKINYDPASKTLKIELTDRHTNSEILSGTFLLPRLTSVDPNSSTTLKLTLPRFITRLSATSKEGAPAFEQLPIHEAEKVEVHVGWSDTPFYADPRAVRRGRKEQHVVEQLKSWESGIASGSGRRRQAGKKE